MQSFKLVVASLSCAELGTAQPQLVYPLQLNNNNVDMVSVKNIKLLVTYYTTLMSGSVLLIIDIDNQAT